MSLKPFEQPTHTENYSDSSKFFSYVNCKQDSITVT